jgi:hypothetical protein
LWPVAERRRFAEARKPCPTQRTDPIETKVNKTSTQVIDDFPEHIPVLERELDVIEIYLGALIDEMLQRRE